MITDTDKIKYPPFPVYNYLPLYPSNREQFSLDENVFLDNVDNAASCRIEEETRMQNKSEKWFQERKLRLTASNFGDALEKMTKPRCRPQDYAKKLTKDTTPSQFTQAILNYGLQNESTAVCRYIDYMHSIGHNVQTFTCGLVISAKYFWLGASPDRKVYDPIYHILHLASLK